MRIPDRVPEHMRSTYTLLRKAFPNGISNKHYFPLLSVMQDTGMSDRSIATAMGLYYDKEYTEFLHDVSHLMPNIKIPEDKKKEIINILSSLGYEKWADEE